MGSCHGVTWALAQSRRNPSSFMEFTGFTQFSLFCIHARERQSVVVRNQKQIRPNRVNCVNHVDGSNKVTKQTKSRNSPKSQPIEVIMKQQSLQKAGQPAAEVEKRRDHSERMADIEKKCATVFGLKNGKVALQIITQAANLQCLSSSESGGDNLSIALGTLSEIGPRGALEMFLAVQMMGVHQAALKFLANATAEGQTPEGRDLNLLRATRLTRLFLEQMEAMQKLKGKHGQQKVTVEHVHVHQGGQAIVGVVNAREEGGREGASDDQSPAKNA